MSKNLEISGGGYLQSKLSTNRLLAFTGLVLFFGLAAIRLVVAFRFENLFVDERAAAGLVKAVITGSFPLDTPHLGLLYVVTVADFSTITFHGPAILWAAIFGYSAASLRVFVTLLTIAALVLLGRAIAYWFGSRRSVWLAATLIGFIIPWNFLQGMLFWAPTLIPVFLISAFWAFSYLFNSNTSFRENDGCLHLQRNRVLATIAKVVLPLALIAAAYSYLPGAFPAVGLYVAFVWLLVKHRAISTKDIVLILGGSVLVVLPYFGAIIFWPPLTHRAGIWAIWNLPTFGEQLRAFISNIDSLFSLSNLFFFGDPNRRHFTGALGGMLGFWALIPLSSILVRWARRDLTNNQRILILVSFIGIALSMLGAALTVEGNPHSLRSGASWIFFSILIALGYLNLFDNRNTRAGRIVFIIAIVVQVIATIYFLGHFFWYYLPNRHLFFDFQDTPGMFPYADYWNLR